jgi:hypothetical protein
MLLVKELARLYMYLNAILFHLMQCNIPLFLARRFPHITKDLASPQFYRRNFWDSHAG